MPIAARVKRWDVVDDGVLGAIIECPACDGTGDAWDLDDDRTHACHQCNGDGELHHPYRTPTGATITPEAPTVWPDVAAAFARIRVQTAGLDAVVAKALDDIRTALAVNPDHPTPTEGTPTA